MCLSDTSSNGSHGFVKLSIDHVGVNILTPRRYTVLSREKNQA